MADQRYVAALYVILACVEAANPHAIGEVVKSHAIGATDHQPRRLDFLRHPSPQQGFLIVLQHEAGHQRCCTGLMGYGGVQCGFDVCIANGKNDVFHSVRK